MDAAHLAVAPSAFELVGHILDASQVGTIVLDSELRVAWVNPAIERFFNLKRDAVCGRSHRDVIQDILKERSRDPEGFARPILLAHQNNTFLDNHLCFVTERDGAGRWLAYSSQPIQSGPLQGGRLEHYADITQRKQSEDLVYLQSSIMELLAKDTPLQDVLDALCLFIEDLVPGSMCGSFLYDSKSELIRFKSGPSVPQEVREAFSAIPVRSGMCSCAEAVVRAEPVFSENIENTPIWGELQAVALSAGMRASWSTPIISNDDRVLGTFAITFATMATPSPFHRQVLERCNHLAGIAIQRQSARDEYHLLSDQLRQAQKLEALGQLAGGVAHDFNNLLTAIIGNTDILLGDLREETRFSRDMALSLLEQTLQAGERASGLTRQLMAFSRKQVTRQTLLDTNVVLEATQTMLARLIGEHIKLTLELDTGLPPIRADRSHIEQIAMNLAINSRDAMSDGGELIISTQAVSLPEDDKLALHVTPGPYVGLIVRDNGAGIRPEDMDRLFDPFFTTKPPGQGTGLGLSTVYGIAKQCGGTVTVHSTPGSGSTFAVYFPVVNSKVEPSIPASPAALTKGHGTVLLCEDDALVRSVAFRVLRDNGYDVLATDNPQDAVAVARDLRRLDLLITDVIMPYMNGRALADRVLALRPETRVLFISGYTSDIPHVRGARDSGELFLEKPFMPQDLLRTVADAMHSVDKTA
jgi:PAS domain S-box-containing protein